MIAFNYISDRIFLVNGVIDMANEQAQDIVETKQSASAVANATTGASTAMARTSAAAVANAFFDIQDEDDSDFPPINQMKLQKLLYYAHAWWMANKDGELFDDPIEAWPWGPIVPRIYFEFKDFGKSPIVDKKATQPISTGTHPLQVKFIVPDRPDQEVVEFLKLIWEKHKHLTGIQLSNATHMDGEPWAIMKKSYETLDDKPRIPNELIRDVFKSKIS